MAVPPRLAEVVLGGLLATLAGTAYPCVEPNIAALPPQGRGRPPRLESRTPAERAAARRARAAREREAAARACAAALGAGLDRCLSPETRARVAAFVARHAPAEADELATGPANSELVAGRTRAQRHRARLKAEAAGARALLWRVPESELRAADPSLADGEALRRAFLARGESEAADAADDGTAADGESQRIRAA